jgi:hypothetical protein
MAELPVIEVIAHDPKTDQVVLMMSQTAPWEGASKQLFELQEKFNAYVSFALDGALHDEFPQFQGKKIRLELTCTMFPDEKTLDFLEKMRGDLARQRIEFFLNVRETVKVEEKGCGSGNCGCQDSTALSH